MQESNHHEKQKNTTDFKVQNTNLNTDFELSLFLHVLKKNLYWLILIVGLAVLAAILFLRYSAPMYKSTAEIQIEKNNQANKLLDVKDYYESNDISAEIELLKSPMLVEAAIKTLPLKVSYYAKGQFLKDEKYKSAPYEVVVLEKDSALPSTKIELEIDSKNSGTLFWGKDRAHEMSFNNNEIVNLPFASLKIKIKDYERIKSEQEDVKGVEYLFILNNPKRLTKDIIDRIEILVLNINAKTLQINYKDNNRLKAFDLVNALIDEFKKYSVRKKKQSSIQILNFLNSQIKTVYKKQKEYEKEIQQFKLAHDITDLEQSSKIYAEQINKMHETQVELELQISTLREIKRQINKEGQEVDIYKFLPMLIGVDQQSNLSRLVENLNQLLVRKQERLYRLKENSTPIKEIDYQIEIQRKLIAESINSLIDKYSERLVNIKRRAAASKQEHRSQPQAEAELLRLNQLYDINKRFYTMLVQKKTEHAISQEGYVSNLNVLKAANIPDEPIAPRKYIIFIGFVILGILLSFVFIIAKYLLHNTITSAADIKRIAISNVKVLGLIPKHNRKLSDSHLIVYENPKSMIAESFRSVRSNLEFLSTQEGAKVLAITSTISGEGKTFIASNLGGIIAFSGKKVVILDLDMRKPKIHKGFHVDNDKGMSTLLVGKNELEDCIHHSKQENLDFITAGPTPPNPSELILSEKLDEMIEKLKEQYDLIIIDNPPVGVVTDGVEVIRKADYPIYVFRSEFSKKGFIHNLDALINDSNISKLSIILNDIDPSSKSYGYANFGGYGYSYSSEYYQEETNSKKSIFNKLKKS